MSESKAAPITEPRMLYRMPGEHFIHDGKYDYIIVPEEEVDERTLEGWHMTIGEAKAAFLADEKAKAAKAAKQAEAKK